MSSDEEAALGIAPPDEDSNLISVAHNAFILLQVGKVLEEKAGSGFHALVLDLPEADLVDDSGG